MRKELKDSSRFFKKHSKKHIAIFILQANMFLSKHI